AGQARVLALVAEQAPVVDILDTLVALIEELIDDVRCGFLLTDQQDNVLSWGAGINVPVAVRDQVAPVKIGPSASALGRAGPAGSARAKRCPTTSPTCPPARSSSTGSGRRWPASTVRTPPWPCCSSTSIASRW